jgi:WD40 repeat protein
LSKNNQVIQQKLLLNNSIDLKKEFKNNYVDKIEPLKEIDVVNTVVLNHQHSQYVDLCKWNPKHDLFITASTDRKAYLWNCRVLTNAKSVDVTPIELPGHETVSCMDWSDNGKLFILGINNVRPRRGYNNFYFKIYYNNKNR